MNSRPKRKKPRNSSRLAHHKKARAGFTYMRSDTREFIMGDSGDEKIKTSYQISYDDISSSSLSPSSLRNVLSPGMKAHAQFVKTFRPIAMTVESSPSGKATVVETPGGTRLRRSAKFSAISFFSNIPAEMPTRIDSQNEYFSSAAYQAIKEITEATKFQSVVITPALLRKTSAQNKKNRSRRKISQNKAMVKTGVSEKKAGATAYAAAITNEVTNIRWEWLHLVAHSILGAASQHSGNLVSGTMHANTNMMFIENTIFDLSLKYPDGFTLKITAELHPNTHLAKNIHYEIVTPDFTLPLVFNAQTTVKPHISFNEYMKYFVKELADSSKKDEVIPSRKRKLF